MNDIVTVKPYTSQKSVIVLNERLRWKVRYFHKEERICKFWYTKVLCGHHYIQ